MAPWPASDFWDWSVATYAGAGVAPACLALQDRHGLDVNLLLFAAYAGARGRILSHAAMAEAAARVGRWQSGVIGPLRDLRRVLKNDPHGLPPDLAASVRARIAAVELDAEHAEQVALGDIVERGTPAPPAQAVAGNIAAYAAVAGIAWSAADAADIAVIAAAATPGRGSPVSAAPPPCPSRPS